MRFGGDLQSQVIFTVFHTMYLGLQKSSLEDSRITQSIMSISAGSRRHFEVCVRRFISIIGPTSLSRSRHSWKLTAVKKSALLARLCSWANVKYFLGLESSKNNNLTDNQQLNSCSCPTKSLWI
jgi:hypothetical protein